MARNHRPAVALTLVLAVGVIAAPAASGEPPVSAGLGPADAPSTTQTALPARSLQAMDAATTAQSEGPRSQTAMDEATAATAEAPRSLPAMDAATAAGLAPTHSADESGFDWGDAGIASSVFAAALLATAGMAFMHRRRGRTVRRSGAPAATS